MASSLLQLLLLTLFFLQKPFSSNSNSIKANLLRSKLIYQDSTQDAPFTNYFEVTKPTKVPLAKPCSTLILQHDFGFTYGKPPVLADYNPPTKCPFQNFSKIILEWRASCKGRQFDRIFGVWLGGVELLRSCTAEPRSTGTVWTVEKDITRYSSILKTPQTLAVYLGNLVDSTYTGVYHVNLTFHYYPEELSQKGNNGDSVYDSLVSPADLIIPISRNLPLNDGLWFPIENSTDFCLKEIKIPRNAYRAVLEVYVSFHENDESWYMNPPNDYLIGNKLTNTPGNGAFREVLVSLDGMVVGAVWPFTVVYTGGVNPLLWRPITGIGSFDLPTYHIDVTPFLGKVLDGKDHRFGFQVTNALNVWFIDANLHVWLDDKNEKTVGELIEYKSPPSSFSLVSNYTGRNGTFLTRTTRSISMTGWLKSSNGNITTSSYQNFSFVNLLKIGKDGDLQIVNQDIHSHHSVHAILQSSEVYSTIQVFQTFPLYLYMEDMDQGNKSYFSVANISLGFNKEISSNSRSGISTSSLKNLQNGQGQMLVKGNLVTSGLGSTQQFYKYESYLDCYYRNVSSTNYTIIYDKSFEDCSEKWKKASVDRK